MPTPTNNLLANPYTQNSWKDTLALKPSTNAFTPTFKTNEGLNIQTTKPILELNPTTGKKFTFEKSQALKDFESRQKLDAKIATDKANLQDEKASWWSKRSKTQKIGIITGSVIATVAVIYFVRKSMK